MAVKTAYRWENGNVMVFGDDGEQITELQGRYTAELHDAIRRQSTPATEWIGFGEDGPAVWPRRNTLKGIEG